MTHWHGEEGKVLHGTSLCSQTSACIRKSCNSQRHVRSFLAVNIVIYTNHQRIPVLSERCRDLFSTGTLPRLCGCYLILRCASTISGKHSFLLAEYISNLANAAASRNLVVRIALLHLCQVRIELAGHLDDMPEVVVCHELAFELC